MAQEKLNTNNLLPTIIKDGKLYFCMPKYRIPPKLRSESIPWKEPGYYLIEVKKYYNNPLFIHRD